ncbi:MAG TPA: PIN domain-containing protein, partial [Chiayiivirga sp.]|nr:PIN domain-containing protein [Chiayiivirga sp.]
MTSNRRIYALDTNVLMHDPTALFKFEEHDVFLPMTVLEELDANKKGMSEASRNARQVSRFINELIEADGADGIATGLRLRRPEGLQLRAADHTGVLLFQTQVPDATRNFGKVAPDNQILSAILALRAEHMDRDVVLVSKDINLRIKAHIAGLPAEDYENDRALDDFNLLYTGAAALPQDFWDRHERELRSWTERGHNFYEVERLPEEDWHPNQFLYLPGEEELEFRVAQTDGSRAVLQVIDDYASQGHQVWGISA